MIFVPFRYRAACKLSYLIPYKNNGYLLVYVNDSCYNNMRRYFDLFGIRHYRMMDHIREKRPATKFNKIKQVGTLHNCVSSYNKKLNNRLYYDLDTLISQNIYNHTYSLGTTKAELKNTLHTYGKEI